MNRTKHGLLVGLVLAVASFLEAKEIQFGGYTWTVRTGHGGPGPNAWDENNVWLDSATNLHLKISHRGGKWSCAEITMQKRLGFGPYEFQTIGRLDLHDDNVVLGLFNGAQIACADMIALNTDDVKESINSFKTDYILIDTPGQLELFVFREAGKYTVKFLSPEKSVICYLLDPMLAKTASGFVSQLLLAITTNFRLSQSQINILSKADLLSKKELALIQRWSTDPDEIYEALFHEEPSVHRELSEQILHLIKQIGGYTRLIPTSKKNYCGIEDIYTDLQQQFEGGEDLLKD